MKFYLLPIHYSLICIDIIPHKIILYEYLLGWRRVIGENYLDNISFRTSIVCDSLVGNERDFILLIDFR